MRVNTQHLSLDTPSDSYLPGGLKNYSTQKVITYSDSTRKTVQENVFCLYGTILNLVTKVAQTLPKSDQFLSSMQTGRCDPYGLKYHTSQSVKLISDLGVFVKHLSAGAGAAAGTCAEWEREVSGTGGRGEGG